MRCTFSILSLLFLFLLKFLDRKAKRAKLFFLAAELFDACNSGPLEQVQALLSVNAPVNVLVDGVSPLMVACKQDEHDWDTALSVVDALLGAGASVNARNHGRSTSLHVAAAHSSPAIVSMLLNAGGHVTARTTAKETPLVYCCRRFDWWAAEIARLLVEAADKKGRSKGFRKALSVAYENSSAEVVSALKLSMFFDGVRDATFETEEATNVTDVMLACKNRMGGVRVVHMLLQEPGHNLQAVDSQGYTAFQYACTYGNADIVQCLISASPHFLNAFDHDWLINNDADPLGVMQATQLPGQALSWGSIHVPIIHVDISPELLWTFMRSGLSLVPINIFFDLSDPENDNRDLFAQALFDYIAKCSDVRLWRLVEMELRTFRQGVHGNTLLHVAAETGRMDVLKMLMDRKINPLISNRSGYLAIDVASNGEVKLLLREYMLWKPLRDQTDWYGPLFRKRAIALLLVILRMEKRFGKFGSLFKVSMLKYMAAIEPAYLRRQPLVSDMSGQLI
jgi:ankyrin repeat protein